LTTILTIRGNSTNTKIKSSAAYYLELAITTRKLHLLLRQLLVPM